jgi:hypothetical protein
MLTEDDVRAIKRNKNPANIYIPDLIKTIEEMAKVLDYAGHELGISTEHYPAPVANASDEIWKLLNRYKDEL